MFFFKQKTEYEMRISDWSSDVCSSDLAEPVAVQIAGSDPAMMAEAAVFNIQKGARIIDINMGCPVKKVCNVASGSALLRDESLVVRILESVEIGRASWRERVCQYV